MKYISIFYIGLLHKNFTPADKINTEFLAKPVMPEPFRKTGRK